MTELDLLRSELKRIRRIVTSLLQDEEDIYRRILEEERKENVGVSPLLFKGYQAGHIYFLSRHYYLSVSELSASLLDARDDLKEVCVIPRRGDGVLLFNPQSTSLLEGCILERVIETKDWGMWDKMKKVGLEASPLSALKGLGGSL